MPVFPQPVTAISPGLPGPGAPHDVSLIQTPVKDTSGVA